MVLISVPDGGARVIATVSGVAGAFQRAAFPPRRPLHRPRPVGEGVPPQFDLFAISADGSQTTPLAPHAAEDRLLGWSPDGRFVLFSSDRSGTTDAWMLAVADGKPKGAPELVKKTSAASHR